MSTEHTAADLIDLVVAIPGVRGIEPGVSTTLRAVDARIRRNGTAARFGLHIDHTDGSVTVEVCLDRTRPIRESVRAIQTVLEEALHGSMTGGDAPSTGPEIHVRVQSVDGGDARRAQLSDRSLPGGTV